MVEIEIPKRQVTIEEVKATYREQGLELDDTTAEYWRGITQQMLDQLPVQERTIGYRIWLVNEVGRHLDNDGPTVWTNLVDAERRFKLRQAQGWAPELEEIIMTTTIVRRWK
jgi:hypothetical protein